MTYEYMNLSKLQLQEYELTILVSPAPYHQHLVPDMHESRQLLACPATVVLSYRA